MHRHCSWLWLPLAAAVGSVACANTQAVSADMASPRGSSDKVSTLAQYHWQLTGADDHSGRSIKALLADPRKPLQLDFEQGRLRVSHVCNAMSGRFNLNRGQLIIHPMIHTMMACNDQALMATESAVAARLRGTLQWQVSAHPAHLRLITADGDVLQFAGTPTAETRYQGPGKVEFLEVAGHEAPCSHAGSAATKCLRVRERHYNAQGLQTGAPGPWHVLTQSIEGFTPQDGVRFVLRVKRYIIKQPPADGSSSAYVLDSIVESGPATP